MQGLNQNVQTYYKNAKKLKNVRRPWNFFENLLRPQGLEKNSKLINVRSTFIPDYTVEKDYFEKLSKTYA